MTGALRYAGQGLVYLLFAVLIGYFSDAPVYEHFPPDRALVKISLAYGAKSKAECRRLTPEEIAKLAPNMRKPFACPRERRAVLLEVEMDGDVLYRELLPPTGLSKDGPSRTYKRFAVPAGTHRFAARLRDTAREEGFDHVGSHEVTLKPGQSLAIDFKGVTGGFAFE